MSYILNALRKSEQERQAKQPETATERILLPRPKQSRKTALWIAAILLSNFLIIAGFIWMTSHKTVPSVPQAASNPRVEALAPAPPAPTAPKIKPSVPPVSAKDSPSATIAEQAAVNLPPKNPLPSKAGNLKKIAPARRPETAKVKNEDVHRSAGTEPAAKRLHPAEINPSASEVKKPESAPAAARPIPFLEELPYEVRQSIPKMTVNVFVYSPNPSESFVVINMEKYKTGQLTKDSVELKEIRPESLVVNYHDRIFRIGRPGPQRSE
jgi:general secretion pathway protein B